MKSSIVILGSLILTACVTSPRKHDPAQPALSWDATCEPENLSSMRSWVLLTCTMTNRSQDELTFFAIDRISSEKDAWRQPDTEELAVLKRDLATRKTAKSLPLTLQGGDRLEGFVAQMLVVSGLWLTQSVKEPLKLPEKMEKTVEVKPGKNVRQAFVLYRDSLDAPGFITLISADGSFRKRVDLGPGARQRVSAPY